MSRTSECCRNKFKAVFPIVSEKVKFKNFFLSHILKDLNLFSSKVLKNSLCYMYLQISWGCFSGRFRFWQGLRVGQRRRFRSSGSNHDPITLRSIIYCQFKKWGRKRERMNGSIDIKHFFPIIKLILFIKAQNLNNIGFIKTCPRTQYGFDPKHTSFGVVYWP